MKNIYDPDYVKRLFNSMSASYERMNYITSFGFSIRWRKQFLQEIQPSSQHLQVIDLMSGRGENWAFLKIRYPNATFHALDLSEEMIAQSEYRNKKYFNRALHLSCQDILDNHLPDNHFDIVTCAYGLKTFNEQQLAIIAQEVHRVLKTGGRFAFVEVSKPSSWLLKFFYRCYLRDIIPILGKLFLGNPDDYRMLWIYIEQFQNVRKAKEIFEHYGLTCHYYEYFYGCASGIQGIKKS